MVTPEILAAFHVMWETFPEPVMLLHKSREILALNALGRGSGAEIGRKCSSYGAPELHTGGLCLADKMVSSGQAQRLIKKNPLNKWAMAYWLPVPGYPELYVHFNTTLPADYEPKTLS